MKEKTPKGLSFGWQRAQLLGAFFNGVFLLVNPHYLFFQIIGIERLLILTQALGVSIFLQSIERFVSLQSKDRQPHITRNQC